MTGHSAASDAELATAAGRGDREAFEVLARRWWERLRRYAGAAVGGDSDLAAEAAQDALVRLYSSLPRFRGEAAFGTFLYRICRNAAIDALRRRVRERKRFAPLPDPEDGGAEIESHHRGPEESALREGAKTALRTALAGLAEEERSLVYLKEAEGLGLAEIGRILGLPEGTVKSRLFRARAKMRTIIEEAGYELA